MSDETPIAIAPDLQQKVQALKALAISYSLLNSGHFQVSQMDAVTQSLAFVRSLHGSLAKEALAHADAHLVPELQALKEGE